MALTAILMFAVSARFVSPAAAQDAEASPRKPSAEALSASPTRSESADTEPEQRGFLVGHGGPVKAVASDPKRQIVLTGSFDYAMMAWDVSGQVAKVLGRFDDHEGAVNAVAFVPGSSWVLAGGDDGALWIWDLDTKKSIHRFEGHSAKVVGLAVSSDGAWAATASWDRTVRLWNLKTREPGPVLKQHQGPVNAVAFNDDHTLVYTASYDGRVGIFKADSGDFVRPLYKHGWGINVLKRVPGEKGKLVFGALDGTAAVIDADSGKVVSELVKADRPILSLDVTRQPGLVAVGAGDGKVSVFRLGDYQQIESYQNPYGPAWGLSFAPGGAKLYIAGLDDFVTLWTITPREPFDPVDSPFPRRFQVAESSDDPVEQGRVQFARKCSVCHTLKEDGKNRAGPTLFALFGRKIATVPGYPFSEALKKLDIVWTEETVARLFELGPENFTPGSKMPLQKMTDKSQRDALIAYLKTTGAAHQAAAPSSEAGSKEQ